MWVAFSLLGTLPFSYSFSLNDPPKVVHCSTGNEIEIMQILGDCGQYGAMKGYDAISANNVFGREHDYIIVLNRKKCIVKE